MCHTIPQSHQLVWWGHTRTKLFVEKAINKTPYVMWRAAGPRVQMRQQSWKYTSALVSYPWNMNRSLMFVNVWSTPAPISPLAHKEKNVNRISLSLYYCMLYMNGLRRVLLGWRCKANPTGECHWVNRAWFKSLPTGWCPGPFSCLSATQPSGHTSHFSCTVVKNKKIKIPTKATG